MKIDKKAINYYYSFFEVSKELNQKQFYDFNMAIYKVMFFEEHIENITFEDKMLSILWKSVKHSIQASVKGFCDKKSIPYDDVFVPLSKGVDKPLANKQEGQVQVQEEVQEKEKEKEKFTFSLRRDTHFSNLSAEYIANLEDYISTKRGMSYEEFRDGCLSKNSYKYKNFKLVFNKWNKKDKKPLQSFKQQDAQKTNDAIDVFLEARANGFDLRNVNSETIQDMEVIEK